VADGDTNHFLADLISYSGVFGLRFLWMAVFGINARDAGISQQIIPHFGPRN